MWTDILPEDVAEAQAKWERSAVATRMVDAGLSYEAIGQRMGLTPGRARALIFMPHPRREPARAYLAGPSSAERYRLKRDAKGLIKTLDAFTTGGRDWLFV